MTVTSTYDHRVIQGAESGAFLATLESLLLGHDGFYERIFRELLIAEEPVVWAGDRKEQVFAPGGEGTEAIAKQARVLQLIRAHRVRGHLWADLDPLGREIVPQEELELSHYGLTLWDLDRRFIAGGLGGNHDTLPLREILDTVRETYCRHIGVEYMHIQEHELRKWLQSAWSRRGTPSRSRTRPSIGSSRT
jgi:2-oxoglutarate dehydrogenase E1 component